MAQKYILIEHFTLLPQERQLLVPLRTDYTRLGFAVLLKCFLLDGRFPQYRLDVPTSVIAFIAKQLGIEPVVYAQYDWRGRSSEEHRAQIRALPGFREATVQDSDDMVAWLATQLLQTHDTDLAHVKAIAYARFRDLQVEPPTSERVERLLRSALTAYAALPAAPFPLLILKPSSCDLLLALRPPPNCSRPTSAQEWRATTSGQCCQDLYGEQMQTEDKAPLLARASLRNDHTTDEIDRFFEHRQVRVTAGTLKTYRDRLAAWLIWRQQCSYSAKVGDISIEEFRAFLVYLTEEHVPYQNTSTRRAAGRMKPASIDGTYRVLQTFWNFLAAEEMLTDAQARFFQGDRLLRPVVPEEPRPVYGLRDRDRLLEACELAASPEEMARNRAIVRMLYDTGADH